MALVGGCSHDDVHRWSRIFLGPRMGRTRLYGFAVLDQQLYDVLVRNRRDYLHLRRALFSGRDCRFHSEPAGEAYVAEALRVNGLYKNFGALQVVRDLSFSISVEESRVVIIGPNGAGKTTLFNLIS